MRVGVAVLTFNQRSNIQDQIEFTNEQIIRVLQPRRYTIGQSRRHGSNDPFPGVEHGT